MKPSGDAGGGAQNRQEIGGFQAGAADQTAIHVRDSEDRRRIVRLHRAAIEDAHIPAGSPEGVDGAPPGRILFQHVPEPKTVKNRWHLDLNVGMDNREPEVARLTALGATEAYRVDEPSGSHITMCDPEGNEFCVQ